MKILTILILLLLPIQALACGSTAKNFYQYWHYDTVASKNKFLQKYGCVEPINYFPLDADPIIAKVLVDAIDTGIDGTTINNVLKNYNCAYGARNLAEYSKIREFITAEKYNEFCNIDKLKKIYIVNVESGVVLRSGAGKDKERISALAHGTQVEVINTIDDWAHVKSSHGEGYVFKQLLKPY